MNTLKILETNILHASDVIYWLDGTSAENQVDMMRLPYAIELSLSVRPTNLQLMHTAGKTALWRRPTESMINGIASEADLAFPVSATYPLAGSVLDLNGRYNPRTFSLTAGNLGRQVVELYPSPYGTRFGVSGGLTGTLRFSTNSNSVPWALLTLEVATGLSGTLTFRAQADAKGDFGLSMTRLPPLPEGVDFYNAELRVAALSTADADTPLDPADLLSMKLGELDNDNTFSNPIGLTVVPGEIKLIRSMNKDHLAVQPS
ncbi:MAG TPA: carboxypeptidase regulatory-like domain-containing protein [Chromatiales bacterium]|nr:carboxypeptidase regulatory-like domain-containing protein [Chromatiales bacterium]